MGSKSKELKASGELLPFHFHPSFLETHNAAHVFLSRHSLLPATSHSF